MPVRTGIVGLLALAAAASCATNRPRPPSDDPDRSAGLDTLIAALVTSSPNSPERDVIAERIVAIGDPAIAPLLDVMASDEPEHRLAAWQIVSRLIRRIRGGDDTPWQLSILGWNGSRADRLASIEWWKRWLAEARRPLSERIATLIAKLTDDRPPNHGEYTPAADELVRIGEPALPALVEALESDFFFHRFVAQTTIFRILRKMYDCVEDPKSRRSEIWTEIRSLGRIEWPKPPEQKPDGTYHEIAARWRAWVQRRLADPQKAD